jgi:hypothetical protein
MQSPPPLPLLAAPPKSLPIQPHILSVAILTHKNKKEKKKEKEKRILKKKRKRKKDF